jgi:DMSO/TMAO reductase YedYZ molybdopterin-dependent catalytic subunit
MLRGRRSPAVALVAVIILVGAGAPLGRAGSGWGASLAILTGGLIAAIVLWLLADRAAEWAEAESASVRPERSDPSDDSDPVTRPPVVPGPGGTRRRFLLWSGVFGGAAALGGGLTAWIRSQAAVATERLEVILPRASRSLPPVPPETSVGIEGVAPFVTPNDDFYRIDTAFVAPRVSTEDWSLRIHGMVDNEMVLDYSQLLDREMIESDITIACVSNPVGDDLIGNARWLGCRLDDLLEEAGIDPAADQVVGRSVDGFTAGFPTDTLDGRDALVAVGMNGVPLPVDHGYPARLIVPGVYGYVSATKWLSDIEVTTFDAFEGYWIPRGWDAEAPVVTMSRIDTPLDGAGVVAGEALGVGGVAWAMNRGIERVEVRIDDGDWQVAELGEQYSTTTWRQWGLEIQPGEGEHEISVRATDSDGYTQTAEEVRPGPNAATGHHTIRITAS